MPALVPTPLPADIAAICIVSYPKTGRTWLRMLVGKSLCRIHGLADDRVHRTEEVMRAAGLPLKAITHGDAAIRLLRHWRELSPDKRAFRNRKVLLLGRDIRDTLVSAYFHTSTRMGLYQGSLSAFLRDEYHGALKFLTFYRLWHDAREVPRAFMYLRYEDLHRDPADALARTLAFFGAPSVDPSAVAAAVEFAAFQNLRKAEAAGTYRDGTMEPGRSEDPESWKFRRGKVGGYVDYLSTQDIAYLERLNEKLGCEFTRLHGC
jgi:hypothetical protein